MAFVVGPGECLVSPSLTVAYWNDQNSHIFVVVVHASLSLWVFHGYHLLFAIGNGGNVLGFMS